jgi:hypothetical protein
LWLPNFNFTEPSGDRTVFGAARASKLVDNSCWYSNCDGFAWHISGHDRICPDLGVSADTNWSQDFCSGPNLHMARDYRDAMFATASNGHLLKDQAIHADFRIRMNDNPIRMREQQPSAEAAIQRDICTSDYAPKPVIQY